MKLKRICLILCALMISIVSFNSFQGVSFADTSEPGWVEKASMPTARMSLGSVVYKGKMYVYGGSQGTTRGLNILEIYDPSVDEWVSGSSSSESRFSPRVAELDGKLYAIGGYNSGGGATGSLEVYDPNLNTWATKSPIPTPRWAIQSIAIDKKLYTYGGMLGNDVKTNLVYSYDQNKDTWTRKNNMPFNGVINVSFLYKDSMYAFVTEEAGVNLLYKYDYIQDSWTKIDVVKSSEAIIKGFNYKDKIIIASVNNLYTYDLDSNSLNPLPNAEFTKRGGATFEILNDKLYMIGGRYTEGDIVTSDVAEYDLSFLSGSNPDPEPKPEPEPSGDRAILVVTMTTGLEKEYDLPMNEINSFLNWYDARDTGAGPAKYGINKYTNNIGPFSKRTEYVIFNSILSFEVNEYSIK